MWSDAEVVERHRASCKGGEMRSCTVLAIPRAVKGRPYLEVYCTGVLSSRMEHRHRTPSSLRDQNHVSDSVRHRESVCGQFFLKISELAKSMHSNFSNARDM